MRDPDIRRQLRHRLETEFGNDPTAQREYRIRSQTLYPAELRARRCEPFYYTEVRR
jgi:hypothetical protein